MKKKFLFIHLLLLIIFIKCAVPPPLEKRVRPMAPKIPEVRVGIAEGLEHLQFTSESAFEISDKKNILAKDMRWQEPWSITTETTSPAILKYRLRYKETTDKYEALRLVESMQAQGVPLVIERTKKRTFISKTIDWLSYYSLLLEPIFDSETEAYNYSRQFHDKIKLVAIPYIVTPASGTIILTNKNSGEIYRAESFLSMRGDIFTLETSTGVGFHFANTETKNYQTQLDFFIDRSGKLTVVNVLPLEDYLIGVVGSEMQEKFPLEALKAQAVTARSFTLARIGKQHPLSPFDLCDDVHCHVYGGFSQESPRVKQAVTETCGLILKHEDKICDTFYSGVCGGYTENNENVWEGEPRTYLQGSVDAEQINLSDSFLQNEDNVRRWIESSPKVFCNTQQGIVPDFLKYTTKYFRWQVSYSQSELSDIIAKKTGQNIGSLLDIVPLRRGVSGRLTEIELRGTRRTIIIEKELNIRKTLSENYLYSSCFVVDRQETEFIIKGAGWGHGVGMCQTGAAMMALNGYNFKQILQHYYQQAEIVRLY